MTKDIGEYKFEELDGKTVTLYYIKTALMNILYAKDEETEELYVINTEFKNKEHWTIRVKSFSYKKYWNSSFLKH